MLQFLSECQASLVIICLLGVAMGLALLTLVLKSVFSGMKGEGCFGYFVAAIVLLPALYKLCELASKWGDLGQVADSIVVMNGKDSEQFSVITVFQKERVRLYQYYQELKQRRQRCFTYIEELRTKRDELKYDQAKEAISKEISAVEAESKALERVLASIEDLAGRIYFSRLMHNLGVNTDTRELDGAMDSIQQVSEYTIRQPSRHAK